MPDAVFHTTLMLGKLRPSARPAAYCVLSAHRCQLAQEAARIQAVRRRPRIFGADERSKHGGRESAGTELVEPGARLGMGARSRGIPARLGPDEARLRGRRAGPEAGCG